MIENKELEIYSGLINEADIEEKILQYNDMVVKVKPIINYADRLIAINTIVSYVFNVDENDNEVYTPDSYEVGKRFTIISTFSDFKFTNNFEIDWRLMFYTPIYDNICETCSRYVNDIINTAQEIIKFKRDKLKHQTGLFTSLQRLLDNLIMGAKEMTPEKVSEMLEIFKGLNLPKNISTEGLVNAIINSQNKQENN